MTAHDTAMEPSAPMQSNAPRLIASRYPALTAVMVRKPDIVCLSSIDWDFIWREATDQRWDETLRHVYPRTRSRASSCATECCPI